MSQTLNENWHLHPRPAPLQLLFSIKDNKTLKILWVVFLTGYTAMVSIFVGKKITITCFQ